MNPFKITDSHVTLHYAVTTTTTWEIKVTCKALWYQ